MTALFVGLIHWFRKQVKKKNGLVLVIPSICFFSGLLFTYMNEHSFAVTITTLLACFALITSLLGGDYAEGIWLFCGAFLGLWLAELFVLFPKTFVSAVAVGGIFLFVNPRFREWRAKQVALKDLMR